MRIQKENGGTNETGHGAGEQGGAEGIPRVVRIEMVEQLVGLLISHVGINEVKTVV